MTEDVVLTTQTLTLPGLKQTEAEVPFVITLSLFSNTTWEYKLQDTISQQSSVKVQQMYVSDTIEDDTRYSKLAFTDPVTGKETIAYAWWSNIGQKLKEVE